MYMYIYIYICIHEYVYIHIYIYIHMRSLLRNALEFGLSCTECSAIPRCQFIRGKISAITQTSLDLAQRKQWLLRGAWGVSCCFICCFTKLMVLGVPQKS